MAKMYSVKSFTHEINGESYTIDCYTTDTRDGFCHHASIYLNGREYKARVSYLNRTWESFDYETTIQRLIEKLPSKLRADFTKWFIEFEEAKCKGECDKFLEEFKAAHDALTPEQKKWFADHTPMIETQEQADFVLGAMKMAPIFELLMK